MAAQVETVVQLKSPHWELELPGVEDLCQKVAAATWQKSLEQDGEFEATLVLADDQFVQELNRTYRNQDKATNVLSFPGDPVEEMVEDVPSLGDIVIAFETTKNEAPKDLANHLSHLVVHGCLHVLGYDHEEAAAAEEMEALEIEILGSLGIANPYAEMDI